MEFFRDPRIEFMKYRRRWVVVSALLLALSIVTIFAQGKLNLGIDFAGGTQLTLKFRNQPDIERLRRVLEGTGLGEVSIQSFGAEGWNGVLIKTPTVTGSEEGSRQIVVGALHREFNAGLEGVDLNQVSATALGAELEAAGVAVPGDVDDPERYERAAEDILALRREVGLISGFEELAAASGASPAVLQALTGRASFGEFAVVGAENVGPQIGGELRRKGILAVISSLLGMLIYIWLRFELRFGIGALVAVVHDVLITLGLYALAGFELNLTTIAAFLTLVGYSVNDSVVVFDRVRENMRRSRTRPLEETMNLSINQTLSRTVLTSGTTLLAVGSILLLGGDVLRGFAFILTIGVLVGTYSSIYVASPFALMWEKVFGRGTRAGRVETKAA